MPLEAPAELAMDWPFTLPSAEAAVFAPNVIWYFKDNLDGVVAEFVMRVRSEDGKRWS